MKMLEGFIIFLGLRLLTKLVCLLLVGGGGLICLVLLSKLIELSNLFVECWGSLESHNKLCFAEGSAISGCHCDGAGVNFAEFGISISIMILALLQLPGKVFSGYDAH